MSEPCCENAPHPTMAPGQTPYTCEELARVYDLIQDAADEDPGELGEWEYDRDGK